MHSLFMIHIKQSKKDAALWVVWDKDKGTTLRQKYYGVVVTEILKEN